MSRLHILQQVQPNTYQVVVHAQTPAGNNSVGLAWSAVLVAAGLARTRLPIGTGPGMITQVEADQVVAGTLIEAALTWGDNPTWNDTQRLNDLNQRATQAVNAILAEYGDRLKWFGLTVA
jgi:hypothetical protein